MVEFFYSVDGSRIPREGTPAVAEIEKPQPPSLTEQSDVFHQETWDRKESDVEEVGPSKFADRATAIPKVNGGAGIEVPLENKRPRTKADEEDRLKYLALCMEDYW